MADEDPIAPGEATPDVPAAPVPESAPVPPAQPPQAPETLEEMTDLDEERLYAALSYLTVLVFVPLLTRRDNEFVNFHARQGLVLLVGFIIAAIAAVWVNVLGSLLFLLLLVADLIALIQALQGRRWKIPAISLLADKFSI